MINEALLPDEVQWYIRTHDLQTELPRILNGVLKEMPDDPLDHVVWETARLTASTPLWSELEPVPGSDPLALRFQVVVSCRGQRIVMDSFSLGECLKPNEVAEAPPPVAEKPARGAGSKGKPAAADSKRPSAELEAPKTPLEVATDSLASARLLRKIRALFQELFNASFKGKSVQSFLEGAVAAEELFIAAPAIEAPPSSNLCWEASAAFGRFIDQLLSGAARSMGCNRLDFLRAQFSSHGFVEVSPSLGSLGDLAAWEERWPHIALPLFHGGGPGPLKAPSLRIAASVSAFVGQASHGSKVPPDFKGRCPSLGWLASASEVLGNAEAEVAKVLQGDKASAAMVVDGVAYGHATGLLKSFEIAQDVLKKALGEVMPKECSGILLAAADEAFLEAEGLYEMEAGKKLSMEQLVDLYAQLSENGWLKTIIRPFRDEDMVAGCRLLLAKRPALCLLARPDLAVPPEIEAPEQDAAASPSQQQPHVPFGRLSQLPPSLPKAFEVLLEASEPWAEAGSGFVSCLTFDSTTSASALPSAMEILLAVGGKALLLPGKLPAASLQLMADQVDQTLLHVLAV